MTRWHPEFSCCIEDGVRELVELLVFRMSCITYSSCQGHPGTPDGIAPRERHVSIVSRDQRECDSVLAVLGRAATSANTSSGSHDVKVVLDVGILSGDGPSHPCIELRFECLRDEKGYFRDLETVTRLLVDDLRRVAGDTLVSTHRPIDTETLTKFARRGRFPLRSPCPNGCLFCYERNLSQMIPRSHLARLPMLSSPAFDYLLEQASAVNLPLDPGSSRMDLPDGRVTWFSFSDFFSQGLSAEQIDRLLTHNEQRPPVPTLYTTGQMLEPGMAKLLSEKHPSSFKLYVSVFTLNDDIKVRLVPKWPGSQSLLETMPHLRNAVIYITHFSFEQTIADLQTINAHSHPSEPPIVILSRLHHNRLHPPVVRELAESGLAEVRRVVDYLVKHRQDLQVIDKMVMQFPSTAYVWTFREFLGEKLAALDLGEGDVVLSSRAAFPVLRRLLAGNRAEIHGVADPMEGSTDFATTVTTPRLIARVQALKEGGVGVKRIVVPSSMWPWDGSCMAGGTVRDLRESFPGVEVSVVDIPSDYITASLTIDDVWDFFESGGSDMLKEV